MIYRLLVGELPLRAQNEAAALLAQVYENVVPPREVDPGLDDDLEDVLLRALSKAPNERYQTASEMVQALAATGT
jgi:serine/threonine-protein kinase